MLVFVDESGHPHPKDPCRRPVVLAVCYGEGQSRSITGRLHGLKRQLLTNEGMEVKAQRLLNRATFRRIPEKREFVEAFFDMVRDMDLTIFAIIMERPTSVPPESPYLPSQFRFLLERVNLHAERRGEMAIVLFDGDGRSQYGGLAVKFSSYLHRSVQGRSFNRIADAPYFVDSRITSGIQIADMAASVIRRFEENELFRLQYGKDPFLNAIRRYYQVVADKTVDQESPEGYPRHGLYRMPEREHYGLEIQGQLGAGA